jgi:hypothetical protein
MQADPNVLARDDAIILLYDDHGRPSGLVFEGGRYSLRPDDDLRLEGRDGWLNYSKWGRDPDAAEQGRGGGALD